MRHLVLATGLGLGADSLRIEVVEWVFWHFRAEVFLMDKSMNAILIHNDDNVVTTTEILQTGSVARYKKDEDVVEIISREEIPKFHKIAVVDIQKSKPVYKYGQLIGEALENISKGSHVHDHNIASPKEKS
jgi:altronate dehydratase small subunit